MFACQNQSFVVQTLVSGTNLYLQILPSSRRLSSPSTVSSHQLLLSCFHYLILCHLLLSLSLILFSLSSLFDSLSESLLFNRFRFRFRFLEKIPTGLLFSLLLLALSCSLLLSLALSCSLLLSLPLSLSSSLSSLHVCSLSVSLCLSLSN